MNKKFLLALLPFMSLASCGETTQVGTYKFMLGKEGQPETQIGVSAELTDDPFMCKVFKPIADEANFYADLENVASPNVGDIVKVRHDNHVFPEQQNYDFNFYEYTGNGPDFGFTLVGQERPYEPDLVPIEGTKKFIATLSIGNDMDTLNPAITAGLEKGFAGYYYYPQVETIDPKYGKRINVGFVFDENSILGIESFYSYLSDLYDPSITAVIRSFFDNLPFPSEGSDLSSYVFATYCDNASLTLKVPVSLNDLQNQLAWYGIYADMDPNMKNKIATYDLEEILTNLNEILSSLKFKDLTTVCANAGTGVEEKIVMPGPDQAVRFGTSPVVPNAKDPDDKRVNEVDLMNRYYAPYFSSTYTYGESDNYLSKNGVITKVEEKDASGVADAKYFYMELKGEGGVLPPPFPENPLPGIDPTYVPASGTSVETCILNRGLLNNFTDVVIEFDNFTDKYSGTLIKGIYRYSVLSPDHKGEEIDIESIYQDPYTFKAYHTLPLTLTRSK